MRKKFLRRDANRHSKLGKLRKKKQKWNKPKGRDNKMREKRKGYPHVVSIGHKKSSKEKNDIKTISNESDLTSLKKSSIVNLGKVGKRKKIEIVNSAKKAGIEIKNLNINKFLKKINKNSKNKK